MIEYDNITVRVHRQTLLEEASLKIADGEKVVVRGASGSGKSSLLRCTVGAMAMEVSYTRQNRLAALAPAMILGVPLFDMLFVMYVRYRRGLPIMLGSPDHVALRLRKWRLTTRQTVLVSYAATAALGVAAIVMMQLSTVGASVVLAAVVFTALGVATWLRRIEMSL